jgi:tetratricopeptide (TPR) repeat protein
MSFQIISNQTQEPCDHGWIHNERIAALAHSSLPDVTKRRLIQFDVTLTDLQSLFLKGREQSDAGQHREALDTFHAVTQLEWSLTAAHVERGNAAAALKLYSVALESYRNAIELFLHGCLLQHRAHSR